MKIIISGEDFNKIMKTCVPALAKDSIRPALAFIEIDCNGNEEGCATALDGYVMAQTRFKCSGDAGRMLLFPCKPVPKNVDIVEIKSEDKRTIVSYGDYSFSRSVPDSGWCVNHAKIARDALAKKKTIRIALNPMLLSRVLKSHADKYEPLFMDIYGSGDAVIVHTEYTVGLLLPMVTHGNAKDPEFWKEQEK